MNIHFSDFLIFTGNKSQSQEHGQSENQLFQTKCIFEQFFSCISVSFAVHSLLKHAALTQFALPIITQLQCSFLTLSELFTMNIFHIFFFKRLLPGQKYLQFRPVKGHMWSADGFSFRSSQCLPQEWKLDGRQV